MISTDPRIHDALERLHTVLQLYSYPGDYLSEKPIVERMAETIEKFEEDIYGVARPKGKRWARVILGQPINVKTALGANARPRAVATSNPGQARTPDRARVSGPGVPLRGYRLLYAGRS